MADDLELATKYNPKEVEDRIYKNWEEKGYFTPKIDKSKKPFVIVIPPPNVTGSLHMGHALNNTMIDILIRRARMQGKPALYVPGTDHAGIATQNVVEKELKKEGKSRHDLGREKFIERVWQWKKQYGDRINSQLKKLGCSCDWTRERFTMDEAYSEAVKQAFLHYKNKGWIYRGERVINWCPRCQTALSDIEVEYKPQKSKLYWLKYGPFILATARPETKLGDTAVAVNPQDKRYKDKVGKEFTIKGVNGDFKIKVIADNYVDPKFGSGAVKVTPAHDISDFEAAERHNIPMRQIIDKNGRMMKNCGKYAGMTTKKAREAIVEDMEKMGLIDHIDENYENNLAVCYRCGAILEPIPSKQWFVKMKELAKPAIEAVEKDEIKFHPERFKRVYLDWMKNLKDWCISRQIWWGHKIPIEKSDDVLDTWFSSALWPFAVFGWPKKTEGLDYFYPTSILSTDRGILYLWVARMIFSGLEFMNKKPFSDVYIHPTVLTIDGQRMSKSLGTGIDPLDLIDKYGADAVRFGITYQNTGVQDMKFDENKILAGQKFANKLWNMSRFLMINIVGATNLKAEAKPQTEADKKILQSLKNVIESVNSDLDAFRFGQAAQILYEFIWHELADVYIEKSKEQLANEKLKSSTQNNLFYLLTNSLKLLHPFMPFITEEIWNKLQIEKNLIVAKWPHYAKASRGKPEKSEG